MSTKTRCTTYAIGQSAASIIDGLPKTGYTLVVNPNDVLLSDETRNTVGCEVYKPDLELEHNLRDIYKIACDVLDIGKQHMNDFNIVIVDTSEVISTHIASGVIELLSANSRATVCVVALVDTATPAKYDKSLGDIRTLARGASGVGMCVVDKRVTSHIDIASSAINMLKLIPSLVTDELIKRDIDSSSFGIILNCVTNPFGLLGDNNSPRVLDIHIRKNEDVNNLPRGSKVLSYIGSSELCSYKDDIEVIKLLTDTKFGSLVVSYQPISFKGKPHTLIRQAMNN